MPQVSSEVRELLPGILGEGLVWLWFHFEKLLLSGRAVVALSTNCSIFSLYLYRAVSQLASEQDCLSGGCGFESHRRDQHDT